jgi:hypothetical protein
MTGRWPLYVPYDPVPESGEGRDGREELKVDWFPLGSCGAGCGRKVGDSGETSFFTLL